MVIQLKCYITFNGCIYKKVKLNIVSEKRNIKINILSGGQMSSFPSRGIYTEQQNALIKYDVRKNIAICDRCALTRCCGYFMTMLCYDTVCNNDQVMR